MAGRFETCSAVPSSSCRFSGAGFGFWMPGRSCCVGCGPRSGCCSLREASYAVSMAGFRFEVERREMFGLRSLGRRGRKKQVGLQWVSDYWKASKPPGFLLLGIIEAFLAGAFFFFFFDVMRFDFLIADVQTNILPDRRPFAALNISCAGQIPIPTF